ncbi:MAG: hypothetical protein LYZ70_01100 [Nitrososphaerales archaeon]|nr:hypothetical protein [Nitrososphaerales archaeon]
MKLLLEHMLPRKLRYAKVYLEAGGASVFFSLDGASADWYASIGKKKAAEMSDKEYSRLRANLPAVETLDDDGRMLVVRNARGYEEQWRKPKWVLTRMRKLRGERDEPASR